MSKRFKRESPIAGLCYISGPVHLLWRQYPVTLCGQRVPQIRVKQSIREGKEQASEGRAICELCTEMERVLNESFGQ